MVMKLGLHGRALRVMHAAFDEAELHHRQQQDKDHQNHRLGRGPADIQAPEPILEDLVDQGHGVVAGLAFDHHIDDAEGFKKGVGDVQDQKEERGRRQKREDDGPEPAEGRAAVDGRGLFDRIRDRLQTREKEDEVVGDLLPGRDHGHGKSGVPIADAQLHFPAKERDEIDDGPDVLVKEHHPDKARDRGRDGVDPNKQRLIGPLATQHLVGRDRKQKPQSQRQEGHEEGEPEGEIRGPNIV